jgi:hypothetical protein
MFLLLQARPTGSPSTTGFSRAARIHCNDLSEKGYKQVFGF